MLVVVKMEGVLVLILVALATFSSAAAEDKLDDAFLQWYKLDTYQVVKISSYELLHKQILDLELESFSVNSTRVPLSYEILLYIQNIQSNILYEFASYLGNVTLRSIYEDLNKDCGRYLKMPIMSLEVEPSNVTCVSIRLVERLTLMLKMAVEAGLQKSSRDCIQQRLDLCKVVHADCTTAHGDRVKNLLNSYIKDETGSRRMYGSTPRKIIHKFLYESTDAIMVSYSITTYFLSLVENYLSYHPSATPIQIKTLILSDTFKEYGRYLYENYSTIQSQEQSTWGIVKSDSGSVDSVCSNFRVIYSRDSKEYIRYRHDCYFLNMMQSSIDLMRCAYKDPTSKPRTWLTVSSAYFHSQCLCLASNGTDCGVKAPQDVDPRIYCLSVLFRDLQRQISYRPAVTYLDYAFQSRVPVCQLVYLIQVRFYGDCKMTPVPMNGSRDTVPCYLKDLVSDQFNCSETREVNTYNRTELCLLSSLTNLVLCDADVNAEVPVPYYRAGDSPLVLFLTYLDVAVRILTLVTYLACQQLRNLPGKLLIGYLTTALLRLLVVRATLADMALAVRVDVASDLASTLCLTCYLHFLTVCIRDLRPPDSLSREESRQVLLRYMLLGWVLPAALSAAFFWVDDAIDFHVQIGQLLFLICNFVALFSNLYMFFLNFRFYCDVLRSARRVKLGVRKRDVFAALFNFAMKTSVLSGAGITFRLVFTQIQGLEQLLGYYHALGTLQGLLVFLLYGCNREARAFWQSHLPCKRRQNLPV